MTEAQLIQKFKNILLEQEPDIFFYKIPDTFGVGGLRPFDAFVIFQSRIYCLEFKVKNNKLTAYQKYSLGTASMNGAISLKVNESNWRLILNDILKDTAYTDLEEYNKGEKN